MCSVYYRVTKLEILEEKNWLSSARHYKYWQVQPNLSGIDKYITYNGYDNLAKSTCSCSRGLYKPNNNNTSWKWNRKVIAYCPCTKRHFGNVINEANQNNRKAMKVVAFFWNKHTWMFIHQRSPTVQSPDEVDKLFLTWAVIMYWRNITVAVLLFY